MGVGLTPVTRVVRAGAVLLALGGLGVAATPGGSAQAGSSGPAAIRSGDRSTTTPGPGSGSLAFARRTGTYAQVYVLDLGNGSLRRLTRDAEDHDDPEWSGDGKRLVLASRGPERRGTYPSGIVVVSVPTGKRFVPLRDPRSSSGDLPHALLSPALSPDGRRVAFTDQGWNVVVASAERRSTAWRGLVLGVDSTWSPDGNWIAFTRVVLGPSRQDPDTYVTSRGIWTLRPDGTGLRRLTTGDDWSPDWSSDGRGLVFARQTRGRDDVAWSVMRASADGRNARRLAAGSSPTWSPDGAWIAFARSRAGSGSPTSDIYVMTSDGGRARRLVPNGFAPAWGIR